MILFASPEKQKKYQKRKAGTSEGNNASKKKTSNVPSISKAKRRPPKPKSHSKRNVMFASPCSDSRKNSKVFTPTSEKSAGFGSPSYFDQYSNLPSTLYGSSEMTRDGNFTGDMILIPQMGRGGEEVSFLM